MLAGAQQCSHDHAIDVALRRQHLEIRRLTGEPRGRGAGAHDQRANARQRRRDGVRQAEGQEVRLGIGAQDAERQHHQPRERAGESRRLIALQAAHRAQVLGHRLGRCRPLHGPLGQRSADYAIDGGHGRGAGERRRLFVERRVDDLANRAAAERWAAREHLEQDRPRREQVAAGVHCFADHLFGRHVAWCPEQDAGARQFRGGHADGWIQPWPRQAEVEQLHAVRREEDVGRLEVAVDHAASVQRRERGQNSETDWHRCGEAQRAPPHPVGQRLAFEELHRDEQLASVLADFVDLADVRMIDARRGPGFAPEALARRLVVSQ